MRLAKGWTEEDARIYALYCVALAQDVPFKHVFTSMENPMTLPADFSQRIGRFEIPYNLIKDRPELAVEVFRGMIIVRAQMDFRREDPVIEYMAFSEHFSPVPESCEAPYYAILLKSNGSIAFDTIGVPLTIAVTNH